MVIVRPKRGRNSSTESAVGEDREDAPGVVGGAPVLGDDTAELRLVGAGPFLDRALEVREIALGDRDGFLVVAHRHVDDAVRLLHGDRPDLLGSERSQAAALDHRRAAHPDAGVLRRDDDVAAPEQRRVAGEAIAGDDPDERHQTAQSREERERHAVEPGDHRSVDVARPAAAALGEQNDREALALGQLEEPVFLLMVQVSLRAGQDHVVVREHRGARAVVLEKLAVDAPDARHESVRRRLGDQLLDASAASLRSEGQRPVLDEAVRVAQIRQVLAGRAAPRCVALLHRLRASVVLRRGLARQNVGEVRSDVVGAQGVYCHPVGDRRATAAPGRPGARPLEQPGAQRSRVTTEE